MIMIQKCNNDVRVGKKVSSGQYVDREQDNKGATTGQLIDYISGDMCC
jgi:hypothetical protein